MIAIAHRLSTIAAMDRLIVLDEGRDRRDGHASRAARARRHLRRAVAAPVRRLSRRACGVTAGGAPRDFATARR